MAHEETLVCTLSGPELIERVREWSAVTSHATERTVASGRIVSRYPKDQEVLQRLRNLIAAEAECCPFMQFTIHEHTDGFEVELRVPGDMNEALAVMLGMVTQSPQSASS